ncbi:hypothetical protein Tco_0287026 [Tanacetum coccineum]
MSLGHVQNVEQALEVTDHLTWTNRCHLVMFKMCYRSLSRDLFAECGFASVVVATDEEVGEDVARIRECRGVACGLKIVMRRREECIRELKALDDCEGAAETIRFMEEMQLDAMNKYDRLLLLINETEAMAYEDRTITTKLNRLCEEMLVICEKRRNLANELRSIRGIVIIEKAAEFMVDIIRKDNDQVARLREVECQMEFRALEKELHVQKITGNLAGVAKSIDIRDQLYVLFKREVNEEFEKKHDYHRLSDELRESVKMRDAYNEEF